MINDLCKFANSDSQDNFIHPIIKGIIIHFILAYIHPFADGNGRTARSLFYWYMIKKGYWLTEYLSISRIIYTNKKAYEKAYQYTEKIVRGTGVWVPSAVMGDRRSAALAQTPVPLTARLTAFI